MRIIFRLFLLVILASSCNGQVKSNYDRQVGGPCEDCEALLDYRVLGLSPSTMDTLPGFKEHNPKIKLTGRVFNHDGQTPAENVILYVYHTNRDGIYKPSSNPIGWEKRHGQFRGWMKTDADGKYTFYTFRPAPYPQADEPEHIHVYVKESNTVPYYIDSYLFMDDPTLNEEILQSEEERGGNGVVTLEMKNGILTATRDIILGFNIPNY